MSDITLTYTLDAIDWTYPGHLRVGAYHDPIAGLDDTLTDPHSFLTISEDAFSTHVSFRLDTLPLADRCGTYQFDVERWAGDTASGNLILSFTEDCGTVASMGVAQFSVIPSVPASVPEPSTLLLLAIGLLCYRVILSIHTQDSRRYL